MKAISRPDRPQPTGGLVESAVPTAISTSARLPTATVANEHLRVQRLRVARQLPEQPGAVESTRCGAASTRPRAGRGAAASPAGWGGRIDRHAGAGDPQQRYLRDDLQGTSSSISVKIGRDGLAVEVQRGSSGGSASETTESAGQCVHHAGRIDAETGEGIANIPTELVIADRR
jgi:hypothetical protein